ncbi:MAG TPA: patatin-like phospholipase family protein [Gemmatimonadaceae bacterium]|nr:patatin-like phospholipase family protein [Gemmatimonadaceae bacterium]
MAPRIAVVIGSGGLKCAAALGLWRVLAREGIQPDLAIGSSGGALYAAGLALGHPLALAEERTKWMWDSLLSFDPVGVARAALPRMLGYDARVGLSRDTKINAEMHELFGNSMFSDARIPLLVAATDAESGECVLIDEGRVADAVRASVSLPIVLPACRVGDRLLMDGGLSNPLPVDAAIREGSEIILAMGFENSYKPAVRSVWDAVGNVIAMSTNHLMRASFAFHSLAHHAEIIPVLPEFDRPIGFKDSALIPYIVECGERAAERQLPYLMRLLESPVSAD